MRLEDYRALLAFSRRLSRVRTSAELIRVAVEALGEHTPYRAGWIYLYTEDGGVELLDTHGADKALREVTTPTIRPDDPFVQLVLHSTGPVVIEDARTDPRTNKEIVARLDNRTIFNVPMLLHDERLGAFGGGTFGDEGVRVPTEEELAFISTLSGLVASVLGRIRVEERLRSSQRLESLGLMAGKIAHDFNNLLTVVSSRLELSRRSHPDDDHLSAAAHATRMAAELSHQLLAYSGHGKLASRRVEFGELILGMQTLLEASLAPGVSLEIERAQAVCPVDGDPSQLRQVVHNLVINASDAMQEKGGTVRVSLGCHDGRVEFVVSDEGVGMDEHTRLRIFDPYFTTKATGRGLGMAAVLGICRAHDGAIEVETSPTIGTTFTVSFPRSSSGPTREPVAPPSTAVLAGRVLIIDDDEGVRTTTRRLLESFGLEVRTATGGREALSLFEEDPEAVDLVYVDLTMPQMNGIEVLAAVGNIRPGQKAVLTSGYTDLDVSEIGDVELVGVVPKPPDIALVLDLLRRALAKP